MKILAIGDLVGDCGLIKLRHELPKIQSNENIDFTIVNAENVAEGMGITTKAYNELCKLNIDVITMGNHTWGKRDIFSFINDEKIIRPANYPKNVPGHGYVIVKKENKNIAVINMIGRTDMNILSENPFTCIDEILNSVKADIYILDFHAEATAEKIAMGYYLDGRVNIIFGTHTHVQTADEKILPNGTGYITDIGMTGPSNSVIGMDIEASLKRFVTSIPERYKVATGNAQLNSIIFEVDDETCKIKQIYKLNIN